MENSMDHYHMWGAALLWIGMYSMVLLFLPFYKKSAIKPGSAYFAFIIAFALEMFGIPFSLYFAGWAFGIWLPEGFFWGHTLVNTIGHWGMFAGLALMIAGLALIITGWNRIYKEYWSREKGSGKLVQSGIYRYIRHPQYTGLFLITLGMMFEWLTIPQLILWPVIIVIYVRLALKEESDMEAEFGTEFLAWRDETGMFLPKI